MIYNLYMQQRHLSHQIGKLSLNTWSPFLARRQYVYICVFSVDFAFIGGLNFMVTNAHHSGFQPKVDPQAATCVKLHDFRGLFIVILAGFFGNGSMCSTRTKNKTQWLELGKGLQWSKCQWNGVRKLRLPILIFKVMIMLVWDQ